MQQQQEARAIGQSAVLLLVLAWEPLLRVAVVLQPVYVDQHQHHQHQHHQHQQRKLCQV